MTRKQADPPALDGDDKASAYVVGFLSHGNTLTLEQHRELTDGHLRILLAAEYAGVPRREGRK